MIQVQFIRFINFNKYFPILFKNIAMVDKSIKQAILRMVETETENIYDLQIDKLFSRRLS